MVVAKATPQQVSTWAPEVAAIPGVASVDDPVQRGEVTVLGVRVDGGDAGGQVARRVVERLRADRPDFPAYATGQAAGQIDFAAALTRRAPWAISLVVLATFVLLFLMTGSVLVPLKALLMNVVSLGASLGVVTLVFQDGHLEGLLHFTSTGAVETTIPPMVLAFGFGLAMDYEVFLLSRIKEQRDLGRSNDEAVAIGPAALGTHHHLGRAARRDRLRRAAGGPGAHGQADRGRLDDRRGRRRHARAHAARARDDDAARRVELVGARPAAPPARPLRDRRALMGLALEPVSDYRQLLAAADGDDFVRWALDPRSPLRGWAFDGGVAFLRAGPRRTSITVASTPEVAAVAVPALVEQAPEADWTTLPHGTLGAGDRRRRRRLRR